MLNVRYGLKADSSLTIGMGGSGHYPIDSRQCHGAVAALILDAVLGRERFGAQSAPIRPTSSLGASSAGTSCRCTIAAHHPTSNSPIVENVRFESRKQTLMGCLAGSPP